MALADTETAIGAVTRLLQEQLQLKSGLTVTIGRPGPISGPIGGERLNLFLYEASFDPSLKNTSLYEGELPPLWFVLKYLITAFDATESDNIEAHELLGKGVRYLQELSYLPLNTASLPALNDNPEVLKITFDDVSVDLLSKLMQGSDEKYRFSLGFQIRPVMITTRELPSHSLLVGIDYTTVPPADNVIGEEGINVDVIPSMGSRISTVYPEKFEMDSTLTISGNDLNLSNLSVCLGPTTIPIASQNTTKLTFIVDNVHAGGDVISAGSHPISIVRTLSNGRKRSSNLLIGYLLPTLSTATVNSLTFSPSPDDPAITLVAGNIDLSGFHLGAVNEDILVSLYQDGKVVNVFDQPTPLPGPPQTRIRVSLSMSAQVVTGRYKVILHANGQQAKNSPEIQLMP